jgi:hypothetical protein
MMAIRSADVMTMRSAVRTRVPASSRMNRRVRPGNRHRCGRRRSLRLPADNPCKCNRSDQRCRDNKLLHRRPPLRLFNAEIIPPVSKRCHVRS